MAESDLKQKAELQGFITIAKVWVLEHKTRCNKTEDPDECKRIMKRLLELFKKLENLLRLI